MNDKILLHFKIPDHNLNKTLAEVYKYYETFLTFLCTAVS